MQHSFARFGIEHLSPSSLNLWRTAPGIWALRYIGRLKDEGNGAMWRGTAVENGFVALLRGQSLPAAIEAAHQSFDNNSLGLADDATLAERDLIEPMVEQCSRWKAPSDLNATQLKIEYYFDPVPIPVIGFLDLAFDGVDIDCKSTKALPSAPRPDHVRQVSLYRAARGREGAIFYVTGKKHACYPVTDEMTDDALGELEAAARSLSNFLARMETRQDVFRSLPVDYDSFYAPKTKVPLADLLMAG